VKKTSDIINLNNLAIKEGRAGNYEESISLFAKAIEMDPGYAESYNNLGYLYYVMKDNKKARKYFKKALEIDPNFQKARDNLEYTSDLNNKD